MYSLARVVRPRRGFDDHTVDDSEQELRGPHRVDVSGDSGGRLLDRRAVLRLDVK